MKIDHFRPLSDTWSNRSAIEGLLNIMSIFNRSDLKTEILKELERHTSNLEKIRRQPEVDMERLGLVLSELERAIHQIYRLNGQIARQLRTNEFLVSIMQRSSIPGGNCNFDLPQYHFWLNQPHAQRQSQMNDWLQDLHPVREAVVLLLGLVRGSTHPCKEQAQNGFYQQTLDQSTPAQLVRVGLPKESDYFVEISGNKLCFNIRFLESQEGGKPVQTQHDVDFELTSCVL